MSTVSGSETCPNCGAEMETYSDNQPFEQVSGECYGCGFFCYTVAEQMNLEVLNEGRKERGLRPLKKLPKVSKLSKHYVVVKRLT